MNTIESRAPRQQKQGRAERPGQACGDASPDRQGSGGSCFAAMVEQIGVLVEGERTACCPCVDLIDCGLVVGLAEDAVGHHAEEYDTEPEHDAACDAKMPTQTAGLGVAQDRMKRFVVAGYKSKPGEIDAWVFASIGAGYPPGPAPKLDAAGAAGLHAERHSARGIGGVASRLRVRPHGR